MPRKATSLGTACLRARLSALQSRDRKGDDLDPEELCPPDMGNYKPHAKCMSALKLAWHLAVVEIWFLDAVIHRHFGETAPMPAGVKTGRDVPQWYEDR